MKNWLKLVAPMLILSLMTSGFTVNGLSPGGTGSGTPAAVGTSTPVKVLGCSAAAYIDFAVTGGTVGTDGCYVMPAPAQSPCAAATPAPNAGTKLGYFIATGGAGWAHTPINFPTQAGYNVMGSEWDAVCSAGSMSVSVTTIP